MRLARPRPIRRLVVLAAAIALLGGCAEPAPAPTPSATSSPAVTGTGMPTPTPTPSPPPEVTSSATPKPSPTGTPEPPALTGDIEGWFTDPRPASSVQQRTIGVPPPSPFQPYDRQSAEVVLYDVRTLTERRLGLGGFASFSPDGTMLAWVTGPRPHEWDELRLLDLRTGEERRLGRARTAQWLGNDSIAVFEQGNERAIVDVATGMHRTADGANPNYPPDSPRRSRATG